MATVIQIKRSQSTDVPTSLANGEFAYSFSNDKLFIGQTDTAGSPVSVEAVGGKYYTDILAAVHGITAANSALIVDTNKHINEIITGSLKLTTSGGTANTVTSIIDDSLLATASRSSLATSISIKNYIDTEIAGVSSSISLAGDTGTDTYNTGETLTFSGGDGLDSAITDNQVTFNITNDGVTTAKLDDGAVTAAKVANEGLGANTIAAGAITHAKLGLSAVTFTTISANTIVTQAEGISANDNDTTIPTSAAVKDYVDTAITAEDLDFAGDTGTGAVDLDSQSLTIAGGAGIDTSAASQTLTINLTDDGVTTAKLDDGAVTAAKVANEGLGANTIAAGAITHAKLGLQSITIGTISANTLVLESEGINSNDNDTTIPTSAAVKDLADEYLQVANASFSATDGSTSTNITPGSTLTIQGTANEVTVGESSGTFTVGLPDDVIIAGQLTVNENLNVSGNLVVDGTLSYLNTTNLAVQDPLIKLANNNTADTLDIGFYGKYSSTKSAGLFRDATDGKFKLFSELTVDPTTTVNTGGAGYTAATLVLGSIELGTALAVASGGTGATTFTTNGILYGNGTSALQVTAAGTEGKVLQAGAGGTPEFGDLDGGTF